MTPGAALLPPLYAVLDVDVCARAGLEPLAVASAFAEAGVSLLQVRAKTLGAGAFLNLSRSVVRTAPRCRVIVNDRPDVASLAGAAGVHVGQDDLPVPDVREIVGRDRWVGLSTHSTGQALAALETDVTYVAIGPVFETGTKETGYAAVGVEAVRAVAGLARPRGIAVVAIGGITLERAADVLGAGATSVCVISDLLRGDPRARAELFLERLARPGPGR